MKQVSFLGILLLLSFTACSPKIGTMITKTYPSLAPSSPVAVYFYQTEVPLGTESLAKVTASDSGFSTNCDSATVVNRIKDEARKIGGNAVCITEHKKPSFWGSSCHQMTAIVLKVKDFDQANRSVDGSIEEFTEVEKMDIKPLLPKFKLGANLGYGWRSAKLSSELQGDRRDFYKKMMSGMIWDASFNYYFNDTYGIGMLYSSYYVEKSVYAQMHDTGEVGTLNSRQTITFLGPVFAMRYSANDQKWIFNLSIGLGYIGYNTKETINNRFKKGDGATVGFQWGIGEEYKFNKNWGIGVDFNMLGGILNSININEDGNKSTETYENGSGEGLGQYRLTAGIRYYF